MPRLLILIWIAAAGALGIAARKDEVAARSEAIARTEAALRPFVRPADAEAALLLAGQLATPREARRAGDPVLERVTAERIAGAFGEARVVLWRRALDSGQVESRFDRKLGALAAVALPATSRDPAGGVLQATVPAAEIVAVRDRLLLRSLPAILLWGAFLSLAAWLLHDRHRRQAAAVELAAAALARGDLQPVLPSPPGADDTGLARSLEGVRRRLRESQEELGRRRSEQESILAGIAEGVFAVDRDRFVRYLSPRAAALLGVKPEEAIGRVCGDLLKPRPGDGHSLCEVSCPILQARFRGSVTALERLRPGDGAEFAAVISSAPEAGGLQVQILREESPDEAARRSRDAVVADLAHELKTPLAAQRASLELLRERLARGEGGRPADPEAGELAAGVEAGALRLERLIDNLLESVRIESGETAIRRVAVDLEEVAEEAVATTSALFAQRGQRLEVELPYPLPPVTGDPPRLTQALVNLLANAAKFAPEGSEVRVGGEVSPGEVRLWVEDRGPGLGASGLPRLSDRYRRGFDESGRAEAREAGSGLGLWIARSIAERHGGGLEAERFEVEGGGRTRMIVRLPASESPA